MKKSFEFTHEGRHIVIENRWFEGEKLFVDGQLQDENLGLSFGRELNGKLKTSEGIKDLKATVGGFFTIECKVFVDHQLAYSSKA
ncbi:hypothetical protein BBI15_15595 [Planococcus plakortidis]|uniref:Uncharacterized protein n=1 Tax=Planococcus plakortidis TaxID=1038856 RepID=A0A1C7ECT7_9BACL|nr:hypothetical protein [Planococcus plakortidis]ANU21501.1 hypothetical protein BBI15_15595 [Planococcus plakortidis]